MSNERKDETFVDCEDYYYEEIEIQEVPTNIHAWCCIEFGANYTTFMCPDCKMVHKTFEDDPTTWLINVKEVCKS